MCVRQRCCLPGMLGTVATLKVRADLVRCWGVNGSERGRDPWWARVCSRTARDFVEAGLGLQGGLGSQRREIIVYRGRERERGKLGCVLRAKAQFGRCNGVLPGTSWEIRLKQHCGPACPGRWRPARPHLIGKQRGACRGDLAELDFMRTAWQHVQRTLPSPRGAHGVCPRAWKGNSRSSVSRGRNESDLTLGRCKGRGAMGDEVVMKQKGKSGGKGSSEGA